MFLLIFILLFTFYVGLLWSLIVGIIKNQKPDSKKKSLETISVIIAARNEEQNLPLLLEKLSELNYPENSYEIIIANDRSIDKTEAIIQKYQKLIPNLKYVKITHEEKSLVGKKNALTQAINLSKNDILAFTDADCLPQPDWLHEINKHFKSDIDVIAGYSPLILDSKPLISKLKNLERASIFAVTSGSFGLNWALTCTARNFAYRKSLFQKVNGFQGIGFIRSGDDDLMLQKMAKQIRKMTFMFSTKSSIPSIDKANLKEHMSLETRRASKWKYYPLSIKLITLAIFVFYIQLISFTFGFLLGTVPLQFFLIIIGIKVLSEFSILALFLSKIKKTELLKVFIIAEILYIPYFIFFGLKGTLGKYKWKN